MKYRIYNRNNDLLKNEIELPDDLVENLSADSAEGFFRADQIDELSDLGDTVVFAVCGNS